MKQETETKVLFFLKRILNYKRVLLALGFFLISSISFSLPAFFNINEQGSSVLSKIGEHCVVLGFVLLIYEAFIHKDFHDLIKDTMIDSILLNDDILKVYTPQKKEESLRNLLCHTHGHDLGNAFHDLQIKENRLNQKKSKNNYIYDITLIPHDKSQLFYKAFFDIEFTAYLSQKPIRIENAYAKNGFEFHRWMSDLTRKKGTIYRYILLTEEDITLEESTFTVKGFNVVDNREGQIEFDWAYEKMNNNHLVVTFTPKTECDKVKIRNAENKKCLFRFTLETVVDKNIRAFPIRLKYPVSSFSSTLLAAKETGIHSVDIMEFINSSEEFTKKQSPTAYFASASGTAQGWVIPDSGLVYVWQIRDSI